MRNRKLLTLCASATVVFSALAYSPNFRRPATYNKHAAGAQTGDFGEYKAKGLARLSDMIEKMQKNKACLEAANDFEAAGKCHEHSDHNKSAYGEPAAAPASNAAPAK